MTQMFSIKGLIAAAVFVLFAAQANASAHCRISPAVDSVFSFLDKVVERPDSVDRLEMRAMARTAAQINRVEVEQRLLRLGQENLRDPVTALLNMAMWMADTGGLSNALYVYETRKEVEASLAANCTDNLAAIDATLALGKMTPEGGSAIFSDEPSRAETIESAVMTVAVVSALGSLLGLMVVFEYIVSAARAMLQWVLSGLDRLAIAIGFA